MTCERKCEDVEALEPNKDRVPQDAAPERVMKEKLALIYEKQIIDVSIYMKVSLDVTVGSKVRKIK